MLKPFGTVQAMAVAMLCQCLWMFQLYSQTVKERSRMNPLNVNFHPGPEYGSDARKYQGIPTIARAPGVADSASRAAP